MPPPKPDLKMSQRAVPAEGLHQARKNETGNVYVFKKSMLSSDDYSKDQEQYPGKM